MAKEEIVRVFESYELRNSLNNLKSIIDFKNISPEIKLSNNYDGIPEENLLLVNDLESFDRMLASLIKSEHFSFDTETTGLNTIDDEIIGISFSNSEKLAWYLVIKHDNEKIFFDKERDCFTPSASSSRNLSSPPMTDLQCLHIKNLFFIISKFF